ncbi:phosphoadenosine phosphosulfate reductase family protein [Pseudomonas putida]|uniref:phosphoadenosine phosphosulfate reductase domain-containing protein n=1 Tax=Pseudomonas putida TaxID=303 RepID=UPI0023645903|nr:phosphoadenosine phosphosulfate reductase family protein [Pseudomonas putida]MDD2139835.1 phosphoadenosine phosphosulfate reductase family protein [Pseudomonas putida]HDS1721758.1 phosphoadenosine phosphosulfate reductase family protein [Pseudomonas putida]
MGMQQTIALLDVTETATFTNAAPAPVVELSMMEKVVIAVQAIKAQVLAGRHLSVAWSGGKDSSVTLSIALMAMRELIAEGISVPTLNLCNADTRMENPVVSSYNKLMIKRIKAYAETSGIPIRVWLASPGLSMDYLVSVIGGRTIMSVGNNTKCQQMTKAYPLDKLKRQVRKHIAAETGVKAKAVQIVSLIGTRFDESATRGRAMADRGESAVDAVDVMDDGQLVLSPIANFSQFDVFEFIGYVRSEKIETYDNFNQLVELYRDLNGGDCMVNAYIAGKEQSKAPCNARTGCWTCARVTRDTSAESLIGAESGEYAWMKPLNDLRSFMIKMHFNPSARAWLARDVGKDGWVTVTPNAYSPAYTRELLGIVLSIQADEQIEARRLGIAPRFKLLSLKQIMAIELNWGRYGYQPAWTAMKLYRSIYREGMRFQIPDLDSMAVYTEKDVAFRGRAPFADGQYDGMFSGLRNVDAAAADCEDLTVTGDGKYVTNVQVGNEYDIDDEGLALFMEFEFDRALDSPRLNDTPNAAIHYLLGLGTVQLFKGSHSDWDRMLRMSTQLTRWGLQPMLHDPHAIIAHLNAQFGLEPGVPAVGGPEAVAAVDSKAEVQGSLFGFDQPDEPVPAPVQERVVQEQDLCVVDHDARYAAAIGKVASTQAGEFQSPELSQMLAHCCTLLSRQRLMHHTFDNFMQLWLEDTGDLLDEQGPPAHVYEHALMVAYSILLGNGLILAAQH